jgi:hypothetical protein
MKKKFVLKHLFEGMSSWQLAGNGLVNLVPLLDTIISKIPFIRDVSTNEIEKSFRSQLMQKFGIKDLKEKLANNTNSVSEKDMEFDEIKINKLKSIMEKIENDEVIKSLDYITELSQTANSSNIKEKLKYMIDIILPTVGIGIAGLADDVALKLGPWALNIPKAAFASLAIGLFAISIPVSIILYVFILRMSLRKILLRYEEYALLLFEVIHE